MNPSDIDANESAAHRSWGPLPLVHLQRYGFAVLSVGAALGTSLLLQHFGFRVPSALLLLFAVAISSWYVGAGPAVLAAILATISFYWYFVEPFHTIYIYWSQIPYFVIFTAFAALLSRLGTFRERAEADLRQSRQRVGENASFLSPALRLALIYAFFGAMWILVSDRLSFFLVPDLQQVERLQTYKGWFFIAVTSVLLWLLASRLFSQVRAAAQALRRLNRELQAISSCNQTLIRATDEQSLIEQICRIICEEAGHRMAFVAYPEHDEAKSVRPVAWTGAEEGYLATVGLTWADTEFGRGPTGTAIRSGKTCCTEDFATDPRVAPWRESALLHGYRSSIALPLKDEHDTPFGSLTICFARPNASTPEEVRLLEELAGDLAFGIVTLRSHAARKQAEEALRRSEAYLAEAQRLSHTGSWAFNPVTLKTHYWSDETFRIWGFDPQEGPPSQEQLFERIHPEDRATVKAISNKALREKTDQKYGFRIVLPDGTVKHIHTTVHVVLDPSGDTVEFIGTNVDVTEARQAGEALRESEANLKRAQEIAHVGSWHLDIARNRLTWSDEVFRIFGVPIGTALTYEAFLDRVHPADRKSVHNAWSAALQGAPYDIEHRIVVGGHVKWVRERAELEFSEAGSATSGIGTVQDITERKRAEEELHESETRFRTFVDHAGDALFVQDLGQGTIVDVNREACESLGYLREELIGNTAVAFHPDSDRAEMESVVERAATGENVFDTHWHRRKDGSTFPVEVRTSLVSYGGRRFLLKVARDITDRLRAEEAVRQSERQLRDVIEGIPAIASTIRLDGSVEFINKRWQEYTGMSTEESVGQGWQSAGHPQDMGHYLEKRRAALASGHPFEDEARIRSRDGKYRWFLLRGAPLRDARGNIVRWYTTAIDIDDRKQAEEVRLEERVRERTRIARELHDTLLQSFQGTLFHFQAASSLLPTRTAEAKRMLDRAIDMAAQAITEGRDSIQGLRSPEAEINDLAVAIRTFGESYAADRGDDGSPVFQFELVGLARELDPTFAGEVYRIAIEALRNSFQHAEARHIKVEIHYEEKEFRVLVRDDGKGIDSKSLSGEGLKGHYGLHGMRERAKLIGSEIAIRSEVGAGTEVQLRVAAITAYAAVASS
jgi:PAS domain S-box-containing protein